MLAVASLAVGVVASLTAPSAHAGAVGGAGDSLGPLIPGAVLDDAPEAVQGQVGGATGFVTGQADGLAAL